MINVKELIYDPDFSQTITVKRHKSGIENHRVIEETKSFNVRAVVTIAKSRELRMEPSADFISSDINVFTKDPLFVTQHNGSQTYTSDTVMYLGDEYKVQDSKNYSQYGFSQAICTLLRRT